MKYLIILFMLAATTTTAFGQKQFSRSGHIWFFSSAPLEDIEAHNYQVTSVVDLSNGEMAFSLLMKGFEFEKALMQEHFNEKYVESDQYPKATFTGSFNNPERIDLETDGDYPVNVSGELTIHGKRNEVKTSGMFTVKDGQLTGTSKFMIALADYDIKIPSVVKDNIAEEIEINVNITYKPMN